jgi:hypothetical protein
MAQEIHRIPSGIILELIRFYLIEIQISNQRIQNFIVHFSNFFVD